MTAKLTQTQNPDVYSFVCPGCALTHTIDTTKGNLTGPDDLSAPSFIPAQNVVTGDAVCQWLMFNGTLRFGGGCTGDYRKTTMDMLDVA